jgi:hypothetical protein
MMARRDRTDMTPAAAMSGVFGVLLAVLIAIGCTLLLVHWLACSQAAGVALCIALPGLPGRVHPGTWLRVRACVYWHRLRLRWLHFRLARAREAVQHWKLLAMEDAACRYWAEDRVYRIERELHHMGRR